MIDLAYRGPATLTRSGASRRRAAFLVCKPKQPAHAGRWLVATAALARTDRRPITEVEPRIHMANDARGSRASTDLGLSWNLLNNLKGHSMAKNARELLQSAPKSVPVAEMHQKPQSMQGTACKYMIHQKYTLCEVDNAERQLLPVLLKQAKGANYASQPC